MSFISKLKRIVKLFLLSLNKREKLLFVVISTIFLISLIIVFSIFYLSKTEEIPSIGGSYTEGMVGSPKFINPLYSPTNDTDRDLVSLLFSKLADYDISTGLTPLLIEKISEENRLIKIKLKEDLKWSDGEKITAKDIVFTIKAIQDPEYRSPLRADWIGVEVEELSELEVLFKLEQPSVAFLNNLSLRIIPSHIWKDLPVLNIALSKYNLNPVGSGPYRVKEVFENSEGKVTSIALEPNPYYHGKSPYIKNFTISFYDDESALLKAAKEKRIDGFGRTTPKDYGQVLQESKLKGYRFRLPRYFALFFNLDKSKIAPELRLALNLAIDKDELIESVLSGRGKRVESPILSEIYDLKISPSSRFNPEEAIEILDSLGLVLEDGFRNSLLREDGSFSFSKDLDVGSQGEDVRKLQQCLLYITEEEADIFPEGAITGFYGQETRDAVIRLQERYREEILEPGGLSKGTGKTGAATRAKLNELCSDIPKMTEELVMRITTVNQPLMVETAEKVKEYWEAIGIKSEVITYDKSSLEREVIKPRNYDILLFGEALEAIPDFFPFWHSSQRSEFGLNLSMYENEALDRLIERLRTEADKDQRKATLEEVGNLIDNDTPAIFLYNPDYLYFASPAVLGIEPRKIVNPSDRFNGVENWYIKTKRVIKR